ncbi:MAG TPA: aspartyl protease family protein [Pirellulales bacterium]|nr:aspartyl protease family protein [Pirellulales bacterium]
MIDALRRFLLFVAVFAAFSPSFADEPSVNSAAHRCDFEAPFDGSLLTVPITFGNEIYTFAIDTGSPETVCDIAMRFVLGGRQSALMSLRKPYLIEFFRTPVAHVGKLNVTSRSGGFVCMDMRTLREQNHGRICGLLGMSFLKDHVIRLDPEKHRLSFLHSAGPHPGTAIAIKDVDGWPTVNAEIPGLGPVDFIIDTGCIGSGSGTLSRDSFKSLRQLGLMQEVGRGVSSGVAGVSEFQLGALDSLSLGPFKHSDVILATEDDERPNVLGLNFWSRYVVTFDFPGRTMFLIPAKSREKFLDMDVSGLSLSLEAGHVVVKDVEAGGPAALGGVRIGDAILSVGSCDATKAPFAAVTRAFCVSGRRLQVSISRGKQRLSLLLEMDPEKLPCGN